MARTLAVLGNLILDDVVYEDGRTEMGQPGGAALYAALGASLWHGDVRIVSRVGDDYPRELLGRLEARGIDLSAVSRMPGGSLRTWLLYQGRQRRVVHRLGGPSHEEASPAASDIPADWDCAAVHLAPMPLAVQRRQIEELAARDGVLVAADPYELLREENLWQWRETFQSCDLLLFGEDELLVPGALDDPAPLLERLARGGGEQRLRRVLLKRGARGGLAVDRDLPEPLAWTPRVGKVVDETGAGDAFAGGVLAGLALADSLPKALQRGVISAGFALEGHGPDELVSACAESALARLREWFGGEGGLG